jgi:glycosyl transferase family 25
MKPEEIPIVVITLDRRPDRWAATMQKAEAANINPNRIVRLSAVDASTLDTIHHPSVSLLTAHNILKKTRRAHYEIDTPGAVGCSLSHFKAWKYLEEAQKDAIIVLEDDCNIPTDFNQRLATLIGDLPSAGSWDLITFYNTPFAGGSKGCKTEETMQTPWLKCLSQMGTHAYMVSRRGAQRLLERAYPIEIHVDAYMAFMARLEYIKMLWHPAMQVTQNFDNSDINHGSQGILSVPTDMENKGLVVLDPNAIIGIVALVAMAGSILSLTLMRNK